MPEITNYSGYLEGMKNGVQDKLFFSDKIFQNWEIFVDVGCADGFITNQIHELFPSKQIIGYDNEPKMLEIARSKYPHLSFTDTFVENGDVYYMSSILHEIYSYQNANEIEHFWQKLFNSNFKYIVIRDMIYDDILNHKSITVNDRLSLLRNKEIGHKLNDFEQIWGKIYSYKDFLHFLLKYQYDDNWNREVRENYLPFSFNQLLEILPSNVRISYLDHRTLPYFAYKWEEDFGLWIDEKIHLKIILEKH